MSKQAVNQALQVIIAALIVPVITSNAV